MFMECEKLVDLSPIQNWNVSNSTSFECMFMRCRNLVDISPLINWQISDTKDTIRTNAMFDCTNVVDKKILEKWNLPKEKFKALFYN
jgi:hypothetical protein